MSWDYFMGYWTEYMVYLMVKNCHCTNPNQPVSPTSEPNSDCCLRISQLTRTIPSLSKVNNSGFVSHFGPVKLLNIIMYLQPFNTGHKNTFYLLLTLDRKTIGFRFPARKVPIWLILAAAFQETAI